MRTQAAGKPRSESPQPSAKPAGAGPGAVPSAREIYELIAEAAYYRAEKRNFSPGLEHDDWMQAEAEVMERLRQGAGS